MISTKYKHTLYFERKNEESDVANSVFHLRPWIREVIWIQDTKLSQRRGPLAYVWGQCGLSGDYPGGPKGADNSAEDYSQDSIFVTPVRVYCSLGGMHGEVWRFLVDFSIFIYSMNWIDDLIWRNETVLYFIWCILILWWSETTINGLLISLWIVLDSLWIFWLERFDYCCWEEVP